MIKISVPGKIHLMGEHSVVYGRPALLSAINLRLNLSISTGVNDNESKEIILLKQTIEEVVKSHFKLKKIPEYQLKIDSEIPVGCKLGSSAAASSALIAGLLSYLKIKWDVKLINDLTYQAEKIYHGNPSGGDNSSVVYGGLVWFRKEFEFLKSITPLDIKIHKNIKPFFLINSGTPLETTKIMVEKVKLKREKNKIQVEKIFSNLEILTKSVLDDLISGDEKKLIDHIKQGERNLEKLGVVGKKAKQIIKLVESSGGAAKILGGGGVKKGSGMILCYNSDIDRFLKLAKTKNLNIIQINLGEEGLRREK